jgi:hypothetical protein
MSCWRFLTDKLTALEPELHDSDERLHRKRDPGDPGDVIAPPQHLVATRCHCESAHYPTVMRAVPHNTRERWQPRASLAGFVLSFRGASLRA